MEINELVTKAKLAMAEIEAYDQEQTDELTRVIAEAILAHDVELAEEAVAETGLGRVDHKTGKNQGMATNIYNHLKGKKSVGIIGREPEKGLIKVAHPMGVVGSVAPTTNPTITPLGNGLMALKGKNAMIVSPHPRALKTTTHTVEIMREALASIGAPKDLLQVISEPTVEKSQELMAAVDVVVATGGPGMVKAAYSSGKPAYGVGPGNVQLILDDDFNVAVAAEMAVIGRSFDNGIVCACTQSLIYPIDRQEEVLEELRNQQAYVVTDETEVAKFRNLLFPEGRSNPAFVGKSPQIIGEAIEVAVPADSEIIALSLSDYGEADSLSKEKMNPVLGLYGYQSFDQAVEIAKANLNVEGRGHSAGILTHTEDHVIRLGQELPVSRIVVNQPTIDAGGSPNNGLNPTVSLGCGSWGNNIISENLTFEHLLNVSRIANFIEK
ncbi:aldehyde dehydrogenase family protein [Vagococcus sp. BWB3-3]|uniref:Aldehyde dehydrogenase family protein n=1 Tax=Vagococcus allomyrinae TaxID=2794353 RepID=A0A940PBZ2_9ENTE|nr:aldehyde dehydrogenase family protein [Vagococcus allomyrinae]MBP1039923.1 aldehyde dehydrogenase family protein [Vagococcus allomyrinae]